MMFVFDLTSKVSCSLPVLVSRSLTPALDLQDTLENIAHWRHELAVNTTNAIPAVLVGNKSDLPSREVSAMEAQQLATSLNMTYIETSAKLNTNVDLAFVSAARRIVAAVDGNSAFPCSSAFLSLTCSWSQLAGLDSFTQISRALPAPGLRTCSSARIGLADWPRWARLLGKHWHRSQIPTRSGHGS